MRDIKNEMKCNKKGITKEDLKNDANLQFLDYLQDLRGKLKREAIDRCGTKKEVVNAQHKVQTWRLEMPTDFKRSQSNHSGSVTENKSSKNSQDSPTSPNFDGRSRSIHNHFADIREESKQIKKDKEEQEQLL